VALIRGDDPTMDEFARPGRSVFAEGGGVEPDPDDELDDQLNEDLDDDDIGLPHWTDPPTGSQRAVEPAGERGSGDDFDAWATITGAQPRWRESAEDFDDEPEVRFEDDDPVSSTLDDEHDFFDFDDEFDDDDFDLGPAEPAVVPIESRRGGGPSRSTEAPAPSRGGKARVARDDIPTRIATGVALAVAAAAAFMLGPKFTIVVIALVLGIAVAELFSATRKAGYQPAVLLGIAASVALPLAIYWRGIDAIPLVLFLTVAFAMLWFLVGAGTESPMLNVGVTIFGVVYVGLLGSFAAMMLARWGDDGIGVLLGAVIATVSYDVGGLFVGRAAGKSPLSSASPNKTVEGLFGGMIATVVVTTVVLGVIGIHPWDGAGQAFILGVAAAIAAPLGDLCESMIKRDLEVKDMGSILPGHGGLLDRFDALLFVLPVTYEVARILDVGF
jgi:phosphatidate cytidylyltransferase